MSKVVHNFFWGGGVPLNASQHPCLLNERGRGENKLNEGLVSDKELFVFQSLSKNVQTSRNRKESEIFADKENCLKLVLVLLKPIIL